MAYKYEHLIPQNTAPKGAKSIGVYDGNGKKVCSLPLGRLTPPTKEKLYSFGLVSDIHLWHLTPADWNPNPKFDNALTYFESQGCAFCLVCGDITESGFYVDKIVSGKPVITGGYTETVYDESQFAVLATLCKAHNIPVYLLCGNHENYGYDHDTGTNRSITTNLKKFAEYTPNTPKDENGNGALSYTISSSEETEKNKQVTAIGNDVFILCGQPSYNKVMSNSDFEWLKNTLKINENKRCFVFVHSYIEEDSGDALDLRENSIFQTWGVSNTKAFMGLLAEYHNAILFHGHSHITFEHQEMDRNANYTEINGFKSVHIPSLSKPRVVVSNDTPFDYSKSQGYIVDVYDDCIVLNGMDFINNKPVPLGTYKIDTA